MSVCGRQVGGRLGRFKWANRPIGRFVAVTPSFFRDERVDLRRIRGATIDFCAIFRLMEMATVVEPNPIIDW